jgi:hypothetical protein
MSGGAQPKAVRLSSRDANSPEDAHRQDRRKRSRTGEIDKTADLGNGA